MTPVYVDSGVLVKLYCAEPDSPRAAALVQQHPPPLPVTDWQQLEVRNALRLKAFRSELTAGQLAQALLDLDADLASGLFIRTPVQADALHAAAEDLSAQFSTTIGCRSLDILHVAAARLLAATTMITLDVRQASLARQVGLIVLP